VLIGFERGNKHTLVKNKIFVIIMTATLGKDYLTGNQVLCIW